MKRRQKQGKVAICHDEAIFLLGLCFDWAEIIFMREVHTFLFEVFIK